MHHEMHFVDSLVNMPVATEPIFVRNRGQSILANAVRFILFAFAAKARNTSSVFFQSKKIVWQIQDLIPNLSKTRLMLAQKSTCLFTVRQVLPDTCNSDPTR